MTTPAGRRQPTGGIVMAKLRSLAGLVRQADTRTTRLPPKQVDPFYTSHEYQHWRAMVLERAGYQCEAIDHGQRCSNARPEHRLFADHIVEIKDKGSLLDLNNGQCLCSSHHNIKTNAARARRYQSTPA
jgi:5-methylcytosine-specific restriction protein A